jgi:hypothetical protein
MWLALFSARIIDISVVIAADYQKDEWLIGWNILYD